MSRVHRLSTRLVFPELLKQHITLAMSGSNDAELSAALTQHAQTRLTRGISWVYSGPDVSPKVR